MTFIPSVTGDKASQFEFDINTYGAVGDGTTNDRPALVLALADAVAAGGCVKFSRGTYRVSTSLTLTQPCKFDLGATIKPSSGQVVTITDTIIAEPKQIFDFSASGTVSLYPEKQGIFCPEWWGAKPMLEPRSTTIDADNIDCAAAFNKMFTSFSGGAADFRGVTIKLSGWYAITDEIRINSRVAVKIQGKNCGYHGTGFRWIGTPDPAKSIIHLSGAEFSEICDVGFKAVKSSNESTRLLAAIRLSKVASSQVQRGITIKNIMIADPLGYFNDLATEAHEFSAGILEGGSSSENGNDDFHILENLMFANCKDGIRVEQNQAVEWQIRNYRATGCDTMYHATTGGQFYGVGWYAASNTHDCVVKNTGSQALNFEIFGMSSEHLHSNSFIRSATGPVRACISGNLIQKSIYQRHATVSVTSSIATSTTQFFTDGMIGQKLTWRTGADAGVRTAIIDTVTSPTTAGVTVTGGGTSIASGDATYARFTGVNEMKLFEGAGGVISVDWKNISFGISSSLGAWYTTYSTADTRMTFNFGESNSLKYRSLTFNNCWDVFALYLYDDNDASHNAIIDIALQGCTGTLAEGHPSTMNYRYLRRTIDAANLVVFTTFKNDSTVGQVDSLELGKKIGGLTNRLKTETNSILSSTFSRIYVNDFFEVDKQYFGCSLYIPPGYGYETLLSGGGVTVALKIGTPEFPELFGRALYSGTEYISRANGTVQMPVSFNAATPLMITLIYMSYISGYTISQSGTTVTASAATFAATDVGKKLDWVSGANSGNSTYITAYSSSTSVTVSDSATRVAGWFELERSMSAGAKMVLQPMWMEFVPNPSDFAGSRFDLITAETKGYNVAQYTEDMGNGYWAQTANLTITNLGSGTYPTADSCIPTGTNGAHNVQRQFSGLKPLTSYVTSIYVKADGYNYIMLMGMQANTGRFFKIGGGSEGIGTNVFGSAPVTEGIESIGSGWWRVWISSSSDASGNGYVGFYVCSVDGTYSFAGNTTSGVQLYGIQLTEGYGLQEYGTSYEATLSATRNSGITALETLTNKTLTSPILQFAYVAKTANYTLTVNDYHVNCTSGTFAVTLETAVGCAGRTHVIKNTGTGVITLNTTSSQTIDGNASGTLTLNQYDSLPVVSDGANWIIV